MQQPVVTTRGGLTLWLPRASCVAQPERLTLRAAGCNCADVDSATLLCCARSGWKSPPACFSSLLLGLLIHCFVDSLIV